ncbi:MAG: bifunctional diguanylate cyclase/phosphodiesterase [Piscinibacter sp.]|nr:bifunctional diguanylate cyclase/phosphodiesterase [Piscinibacter sp.]
MNVVAPGIFGSVAVAAVVALGLAAMLAVAWRRRRAQAAARPGSAPPDADIDAVTGLLSRQRFELVLQERLLLAEKQGADSCVLHVGLDNFRLMLDDAGAAFGDQVLRAVASRLRALAGSTTPLARSAGDEFVLCLNASREAGEKLALRITQALAEPLSVEGRALEPGASVGLAIAPEHGSSPRLIAKAAAATRAVQRSGGGAHAVFDPRIEAEHNDELSVARELQTAVAKGQLELFFQPKIDARKLEVAAVEALLRWRHPTMGLVSPARFIPIAERQGLIEPLGQWVLDSALKQAATWSAAGLPLPVAVNIAGAQFRRDDFAAKLERSLKAHKLAPGALTCEIAEVVALEDTEATRAAFAKLQRLGVRIAVGDFAGHPAGLAALGTLPAQEVKLGRALVAGLSNDGDARRAVEQVVAAAHARGLRVVAEGVENETQRDQVVRFGCDELQGYLFAKPMSARAVALWAIDANRNLAQTFRPSMFKDTQPYEAPTAPQAFAPTRISLRR